MKIIGSKALWLVSSDVTSRNVVIGLGSGSVTFNTDLSNVPIRIIATEGAQTDVSYAIRMVT